MDTKVRAKPYNSVDALKANVMEEWGNLSEEFIVRSCSSFRYCVEAVITANGLHIEWKDSRMYQWEASKILEFCLASSQSYSCFR